MKRRQEIEKWLEEKKGGIRTIIGRDFNTRISRNMEKKKKREKGKRK